jgi:hypothetical protein
MRRLLPLLALASLLAACRGGGLSESLSRVQDVPPGTTPPPYGGPGAESPGARRPPVGGPGVVALTAADLAPVDAYIDYARNEQWILGDEVDVVASREFFGPALTVYPRIGLVDRRDEEHPDESVVVLTYRGSKFSRAVQNNPRVLIGTGLTISARKVLRVRLVKTRDPQLPVRLEITARGEATRGRKDKVEQRADVLTLGGFLRRTGDAYRWQPLGG